MRLVRLEHMLNFNYRDAGVEVHDDASCIMFTMKQFLRHNILPGLSLKHQDMICGNIFRFR